MRSLEAESDRWFLWIPVLFAGGILSYFRASRRAWCGIRRDAVVIAAVGLCLAARGSAWPCRLKTSWTSWSAGQMGGILAGRRLHPAVNLRQAPLMVLGDLWLCLWRTLGGHSASSSRPPGCWRAEAGTRPDVRWELEGRSLASRRRWRARAAARQTGELQRRQLAARRRGRPRCGGRVRERSVPLRPAWVHRQGKGQTIALIRRPAALEEDCRDRRHRHRPPSVSAMAAGRHGWSWTGTSCKRMAPMPSISRGCRSGAKGRRGART